VELGSLGPRHEGLPRLVERHLAGQRLVLGLADVGGVRADDVEGALGPLVAVAQDEGDRPVRPEEPPRVCAGHLEGRRRAFRGLHVAAGPLRGHGDAHSARSCADVEDPRLHPPVGVAERKDLLDEALRLRPGDEDGGGHGELEGPELAEAPDVGHGLAALAPPGQLEDPENLLVLQLDGEIAVELGAVLAQAETEQDLGIEPRGLDARPLEDLGETGENPGDGPFGFF